jgi:CheY-like chemotaxis protein
VLVIDDSVDTAHGLREVLQSEGYDVQVAYDGAQGLERARAIVPDIVLCDIGLPLLDGFQVARTLRADPELGCATIVALTGYDGREDVAKAIAAGFDAHFAKPLMVDVFVSALAILDRTRRSA